MSPVRQRAEGQADAPEVPGNLWQRYGGQFWRQGRVRLGNLAEVSGSETRVAPVLINEVEAGLFHDVPLWEDEIAAGALVHQVSS